MSTREPRGLGKGLSALLGDASSSVQDLRRPAVGFVNPTAADIVRIGVDQIEANPFQPRMSFNQESLEELSSSIRTLGLIQPLTVRRTTEGKYQIISGERRFKACCMAGLTSVPAYVREANDQGMLEMAIVENIQREDLDPIETAMGYQRLMDECSLTQDQMAARVGKKRASIANYLRMLRLPAKIQHDIKVGLLSVGHAKAILGLDDAQEQNRLCDIAISEGLSVRQLEDLVRKLQNGEKLPEKPHKPAQPQLPESFGALSDRIREYFPAGARWHRNADGKGSLTIKFNSDEEVEAFLGALTR